MRAKARKVVLCSCAFLAWAALVACQVGASFGFESSALLGLFCIAPVVGLFIASLLGFFTRRWRAAWYFLAALAGVAASLAVSRGISARQREASIAAAEPIIAAAGRFHTATGAYPRSLADLIPAYLPGEPRTKMGFRGTSFRFSSGADGFEITFALPVWRVCSYDSRTKQWRIRD